MKQFFGDKRIFIFYIVVIIVLIIGVTYALVRESIVFNLTTAMIGIDETVYGSTTFDSSNVDFKPILDDTVGTTSSEDNIIKIDFNVRGDEKNDSDEDIIYDIALNDLDLDCSLLSPYIKWKLIKNGTEISNGSLDYKFDTIQNGRLVLTSIQQDLPKNDEDYDEYTFYMWFSDSCQSDDLSTCINNNQLIDQSQLLGQTLNGKIEVELYTNSKKSLERSPSDSLDKTTCTDNYQVTFNLNGGTISDGTTSINVVNNSPYGTLPTPTKGSSSITYDANGGTLASGVINPVEISWAFGGWYQESTFVNKVTSDTVVTNASDHTLYAKWTSDTSTSLPSATRTGYIFLGWYTAENGGTKVGEAGDSYLGSFGNVTLYAHWRVNTYTVTYNSGNLIYGLNDQSSTTVTGITYSISDGVVTVTSLSDDGNGYTTGRVYLEANQTYYFSCDTSGVWDTTADGVGVGNEGDSVEAFLMLDGAQTTYYLMSSNNNYAFTPTVTGTYWLRLDVNTSGKTYTFSNIKIYRIISTETVNYGDSVDLLKTIDSTTAFTFEGWNTTTNATTVLDSYTMPVSNVTLYGVWSQNSYTVTYNSGNLLYNLDNQSSTATYAMTYSISSGTVIVTSNREDGWGYTSGRVYLNSNYTYTFSCTTNGTWSSTDATTGDTVEAWLMQGGGTTNYVHLDSNNNFTFTPPVSGTYWLRLDVNTISKTYTFSDIKIYRTISTATVNYGDSVDLSKTDDSITGLTFKGWNTTMGATTALTSYTMPASNVTLYGVRSVNSYTLTYNSGNLIYGLLDADATTASRMTYSISNGTVTVTASSDDGYGYTTASVYLDSNYTYTFSCTTNGTWSSTDTKTGDTVEAFLMKDKTTTSYVHLDSNSNFSFTPPATGTYWLRLDVNTSGKTYTFSNITISTNFSTASVKYQKAVDLSPTFSKNYFSFAGWNTSINASTVLSSYYMPASNKTLYGVYTHKTGTVIIDDSCSRLNIRSGPGQDDSGYSILGKLHYGDQVYILDTSGDWYYILANARSTDDFPCEDDGTIYTGYLLGWIPQIRVTNITTSFVY